VIARTIKIFAILLLFSSAKTCYNKILICTHTDKKFQGRGASMSNKNTHFLQRHNSIKKIDARNTSKF